jgi:hypothetical protein
VGVSVIRYYNGGNGRKGGWQPFKRALHCISYSSHRSFIAGFCVKRTATQTGACSEKAFTKLKQQRNALFTSPFQASRSGIDPNDYHLLFTYSQTTTIAYSIFFFAFFTFPLPPTTTHEVSRRKE